MRKIKSKEQIKKIEMRNKALVGVVLIALMIFSTAGFAFYGHGTLGVDNTDDIIDETLNYNGQYLTVNSGGQQFYFSSGEDLIKDIPVNIQKTVGDYTGQTIYVDSENEQNLIEISNNLGRYGKILPACYGSCERDVPEFDCSQNILVIRDNSERKVYQENNCIFIEGGLSSIDAFLYEILSIN